MTEPVPEEACVDVPESVLSCVVVPLPVGTCDWLCDGERGDVEGVAVRLGVGDCESQVPQRGWQTEVAQ